MNDLRKRRGGVRDAEIIGLQNENYKQLKQAEVIWVKLKDAFEKSTKKKASRCALHGIVCTVSCIVLFTTTTTYLQRCNACSWTRSSWKTGKGSWSCSAKK